MTIIYYSACGDVRGDCGHRHRTESAAQACCDRDHADIRKAYPSTFPTVAYSDRVVVAHYADGSEACPAQDRESENMDAEYAAQEERLRRERAC